VYFSQFVVMIAMAKPPIGPLAPVGFIMLAVLALLNLVPAYVGAFVRSRWDRDTVG
jgi:hypothetical protein